jgi:KUP system potassium uptake protein
MALGTRATEADVFADAAATFAHPERRVPALTIAAIGVVYGDIGTSPLYAMREALGEGGVLPLTKASVLGVSLIFWSLFAIVTLKYVIVILRADNRGEGGILALAALAQRELSRRGRRTVWCWPWAGRRCSMATP